MKKIKIFIGSSIDELKDVRNSLARFFVGLNNKYISKGIFIEAYFCEEVSGEMHTEGSQKQHDDYIEKEADATFFMFCEKAGPYTVHELKIARNSLDATKKPNIFVFFKMIDNDVANNADIANVIELITKEYGHYYKKFDNEDTIKLEILQYFITLLGDEFKIGVSNGKIYLNGDEVRDIDINNILAYHNNIELKKLKEQVCEIEDKIDKAMKKKDYELMGNLSRLRSDKLEEISNLEISLFELLSAINKNLIVSHDAIYQKAFQLVELGKIKEAIDLLPNIKTVKNTAHMLLTEKKKMEELFEQKSKKIIEDILVKIELLKCDIFNENRFIDIEDLYDSILDLLKELGLMYVIFKYCLFLKDIKKCEKSINIIEGLEKEIEKSNNQDCYYNFFNLLAMMYEIIGNVESAEKIYKKLIDKIPEDEAIKNQKQLGTLYNNLGYMYSNVSKYKKEIFAEAETNLLKAIRIRELICEKTNSDDDKQMLLISYGNIGVLYSHNKESLTVAESYLKKAIGWCKEIKRSSDSDYLLATSYNNLAHLYILDSSKTNIAMKNYKCAMKLWKELYKQNPYMYCYQYASTFIQMSGLVLNTQPDLAEKYCKEANEILAPFLKTVKSKDIIYAKILSDYSLSEAHVKTKNFKEAFNVAVEALKYYEELEEIDKTVCQFDSLLRNIVVKLKMRVELVRVLYDLI